MSKRTAEVLLQDIVQTDVPKLLKQVDRIIQA